MLFLQQNFLLTNFKRQLSNDKRDVQTQYRHSSATLDGQCAWTNLPQLCLLLGCCHRDFGCALQAHALTRR